MRNRQHAPSLRLVASRPADPHVRPGSQLRHAIAESVAARFRGMWVPASIDSAGVLKLIEQHVTEVRGFAHPDDVAAIVSNVVEIIVQAEAGAVTAFRRPPRRRPLRIARGEQLAFSFGGAA